MINIDGVIDVLEVGRLVGSSIEKSNAHDLNGRMGLKRRQKGYIPLQGCQVIDLSVLCHEPQTQSVPNPLQVLGKQCDFGTVNIPVIHIVVDKAEALPVFSSESGITLVVLEMVDRVIQFDGRVTAAGAAGVGVYVEEFEGFIWMLRPGNGVEYP